MKKTKKYLMNSIRQPYQKNVLKIILKMQHVIYEKTEITQIPFT